MALAPVKSTLRPMSQKEIDRLRREAERGAASASQVKPISHPLQVAAQILQGGMAGWQEGKADSAQADFDGRRASGMQSALAAMLKGEEVPAPSAAMGSAPAGPMTTGSVAPIVPGGSFGDPSYRDAIAKIESDGSGGYAAVGPRHPKMGRALGRYQVMEANIGPWSREALGREVTADEFMANPQLQDAIFDHRFGGYVEKYGNPQDAASAWFTGGPLSQGANKKDVFGTTGSGYVNKFSKALGQPSPAPVQVASLDPAAGMASAYAGPQPGAPAMDAVNAMAGGAVAGMPGAMVYDQGGTSAYQPPAPQPVSGFQGMNAAPPTGGIADPHIAELQQRYGITSEQAARMLSDDPASVSPMPYAPQSAAEPQAPQPTPYNPVPVQSIPIQPGASMAGAQPFPQASPDSMARWDAKMNSGDPSQVGDPLGSQQAVIGQLLGGNLTIPGQPAPGTPGALPAQAGAGGQSPGNVAVMGQMLAGGGAAAAPPQSDQARALIATLMGDPATEDIGQMLFAEELKRRQQAAQPPKYGFEFAPDGTLIRTDDRGGFSPMGQYAKPGDEPDRWGPPQQFRNGGWGQQHLVTGEIRDVPNPAKGETPTPYTDAGKMEADRRAGFISPDAQLPPDPKAEGDLRKEYAGLSKVYRDIGDAFGRVQASGEDAAGDMALIFNFMKMLDPGSVVRESDFANAQNAAGVPDQVRNMWNKLLSGERLAPNQRSQFKGQAQSLFQQAATQQEAIKTQFTDYARQYGYDPARVVTDFGYDFPAPGQEAAPAGSSGSDPALQQELRRRGLIAPGGGTTRGSGANGSW